MRRPGLRFLTFAIVTGGLTLLIGALIARVAFDDRYELTATFSDVTGLFPGDAVRVSGVEVGAVRDLKAEAGRAVVRFDLRSDVLLPDDSEISVGWLNLIGQRQIDIFPGTSPSTVPTDGTGELIRTRSVIDIGAVADQLGPFARVLDPARINELLETLFIALEGRESDVGVLAHGLEDILGALAERDSALVQIIDDYGTVADTLARRDVQIATMVDNLLLLAEAFAESDQVLGTMLDDVALVSGNLAGFLDRNAGLLGQLLEDVAVVTGVATDRLDDLESIVDQLPAATRALFEGTRRGQFLSIHAACLQPQQPPCLGPMQVPLAPAGSGVGRLADASSFAALMVGGG